jgi:hypothetical protein
MNDRKETGQKMGEAYMKNKTAQQAAEAKVSAGPKLAAGSSGGPAVSPLAASAFPALAAPKAGQVSGGEKMAAGAENQNAGGGSAGTKSGAASGKTGASGGAGTRRRQTRFPS